ncbi:PEP/pyruvate-binding domain-containing protein [Zavarzinia aquatilis]|uniref:Pyruvate, phosphate dikinase n=1 Tax=Zavarzinia aquatilis TaxID=2211142 RepID=A0A317EGC6_9PROT|nr:PEP/pyruvate-binding domain-containing protein [Zavarzinia aquatilis]PWR25811.1 pyruvate, phosphate dikinase [Zavarzinia aquatilis]
MSRLKPLFIGTNDAHAELTAELAGAKAAQLWRMAQLGLDVPPAFVLPTTLCTAVNSGDPSALEALDEALAEGIAGLEAATGRRFGDSRTPLLVSVRSGAAKSMPGMLETVLDVGLNPVSLRGIIAMTGNPRLAFDSYRRLIQLYGEVVAGVPASAFEERLIALIAAEAAEGEAELDPEALERLAHDYLAIFQRHTESAMPAEPMAQLRAAARAVYRSWEGDKAREYRRLNGLEGLAGTAVTVQAMVFGNAGGASGAGVAFSRNPATGEKGLYADFLFDAQGEDVVSGRRVPGDAALLARRLPVQSAALSHGADVLERAFADMQDIEFTVENGRLWFLQTRSAKRTPRAALRFAVDAVAEGLIDAATALDRLAAIDLEATGISRFAEAPPILAAATVASPGVACGRVAFDSRRAAEMAAAGDPVILVRHDTSTDDVAGFAVSAGILTAVGGRTAHAAVVARQMGKPCLVGCAGLVIGDEVRLGGEVLREGDWLCLDGQSGEIGLGRREIVVDRPEEALRAIEGWRKAG